MKQRTRPLKNPDAYDHGVTYGIRLFLRAFAESFYKELREEEMKEIHVRLRMQFAMDGRETISDMEFAYRMFAEIVAKYGPPELQPPFDFKQFENADEAPKKQGRKPAKLKPRTGH